MDKSLLLFICKSIILLESNLLQLQASVEYKFAMQGPSYMVKSIRFLVFLISNHQ